MVNDGLKISTKLPDMCLLYSLSEKNMSKTDTAWWKPFLSTNKHFHNLNFDFSLQLLDFLRTTIAKHLYYVIWSIFRERHLS